MTAADVAQLLANLRAGAAAKRSAAVLAWNEAELHRYSDELGEQDKRRSLVADFDALVADERHLLGLVREVEEMTGAL